MRCTQLGLDPTTCREHTTCMRATNVRGRTTPPLPARFCGNAVIQTWTELPVCELLAMSTAAVALRLRTCLRAQTPARISATTRWLAHEQASGRSTTFAFDPMALTFIISSWNFAWQEVVFGEREDDVPVAFDHGALVPIVSNFTPRENGDGLNVWHSGKREALEQFAALLTANDDADGEHRML
jgi:hypothetical protein